jgi:hypothetical protein
MLGCCESMLLPNGILPSEMCGQWRNPYEIPMFTHFYEWGLALPTSDFFPWDARVLQDWAWSLESQRHFPHIDLRPLLLFFWDWHSTTQTLTTRTHTHPYEYTYANPTPMSTFEGLSTDRSGDSQSHHWRLVVDGNVAYHLTHNAGKSRNKSRKRCEHQGLNPGG